MARRPAERATRRDAAGLRTRLSGAQPDRHRRPDGHQRALGRLAPDPCAPTPPASGRPGVGGPGGAGCMLDAEADRGGGGGGDGRGHRGARARSLGRRRAGRPGPARRWHCPGAAGQRRRARPISAAAGAWRAPDRYGQWPCRREGAGAVGAAAFGRSVTGLRAIAAAWDIAANHSDRRCSAGAVSPRHRRCGLTRKRRAKSGLARRGDVGGSTPGRPVATAACPAAWCRRPGKRVCMPSSAGSSTTRRGTCCMDCTSTIPKPTSVQPFE